MELLLASAHTAHWSITALFALLLVGVILCLALEEKIHAKKSIIAASFAAICLLLGTFTGILSFEKIVVGSHRAELRANDEVEVLIYSEEDPDSSEVIEVTGDASDADESQESHESPADDHGDRDDDEDHGDHAKSEHHTLHVDGHRLSTPCLLYTSPSPRDRG